MQVYEYICEYARFLVAALVADRANRVECASVGSGARPAWRSITSIRFSTTRSVKWGTRHRLA